jgi:hypothetical protein
VIAEGAALGELDEFVAEIPMCAECATRQRRALRRPLYARRWFVLVPGLVTALASALVPLPNPLLAAVVFALLVGAWLAGLRWYRAARSSRLVAMVCGGRHGVVDVAVARRPEGPPTAAPRTAYRSAEGLEVTPAPGALRARDELSTVFMVGGTIAGAVIAGVAWNGLYVDVHCTNGDALPASLVLDDDVIPVAKGSIVRYVRAGSHVFGVECPGGKRRLFQADTTADDRVYVDVQSVCKGGETPKIRRSYGGGDGSPFRGI